MNPSAENKRIGYIDTAKGICILLVVVNHIDVFTAYSPMLINDCVSSILSSFRMPLYFILSGLFFKEYSGLGEFACRKTNKLLIPFLFFYLATCIVYPLIKDYLAGGIVAGDIPESLYEYAFSRTLFNGSIWFLLCLFITNILFYVGRLLSRFSNMPQAWFSAYCILAGMIGCGCSSSQVSLPLYMDTAFTALPFFAFGNYVRQAGFLQTTFSRGKTGICLVICLLVLYTFNTPINLMYNQFESNFGLYACGIAGTILVLTLSRMFGRIYGISYFGRYSIIILCTNRFVIAVSMFILHTLHCPSKIMFGCIFFTTMLLYLLVIPIMRRYCPHVTAQKDLIKPYT